MRRYETIIIVDPDLSENDRTSLFTRIKEIIPQQEGVLIAEDLWGSKKLAYSIKKKPRGFYARFDYCGMGPVVDELERFFRIDDRVMKCLTVQLDADVDAEQIQADLAAAKTPAEPEANAPQETETAPETPSGETPAAAVSERAETTTKTSQEE